MAQKSANPIEVEKFLAGMDYPADKEDLRNFAREQGADASVLDIIDGLPEGIYRSPADISREIGRLA